MNQDPSVTPAPQKYAYYYTPRVKPPKITLPVTAKDRLFALLFLLFSVLWCDFALFGHFNLGFCAATGIFFLLMTVYLLGKGVKLPLYPLVCGLLATVGTVPFALYNDSATRVLSFLSVIGLFSLYGCYSSGCGRYSAGSFRSVYDLFYLWILGPFQHLGITFRSLFGKSAPESKDKTDASARSKRRSKIFIGAAAAVPALAILLPLMIRSNAVFAQWMSYLIFHVQDVLLHIVLGVCIFPFLFSVLFAWKKQRTVTPEPGRKCSGRLDPLAIGSFLSVISVVYVVYMLAQAAYFFSVFAGHLPEEYAAAVSDFARKGFFEMCAIAAINLVLLFLTMLLVKKTHGRIPSLIQVLSSFLCLFTLLLIGTALAKMFLYIGEFGLTRLRFVTSCFMIFLGLVFLWVIFRLFIRRFPYMKAIVLSFCIVGLTVSFCDIDTTIAKYNVTAYQTGKLETVDVATLSELSDGAVPYLFALTKDSDVKVVNQAHDALVHRLFELCDVSCSDDDSCRHTDIDTYLWQKNEEDDARFGSGFKWWITADSCEGTVTVTPKEEKDFRRYNRARRQAEDLLTENAQWILQENTPAS